MFMLQRSLHSHQDRSHYPAGFVRQLPGLPRHDCRMESLQELAVWVFHFSPFSNWSLMVLSLAWLPLLEPK